jgi:hypothetical protein
VLLFAGGCRLGVLLSLGRSPVAGIVVEGAQAIAGVVDFLKFGGGFFLKPGIVWRNAIGMPDESQVAVCLVDFFQTCSHVQAQGEVILF